MSSDAEFIKRAKRKRGVECSAEVKGALVDFEFWVVDAEGRALVLIPDPEEDETSGDAFGVKGEIFSPMVRVVDEHASAPTSAEPMSLATFQQ